MTQEIINLSAINPVLQSVSYKRIDDAKGNFKIIVNEDISIGKVDKDNFILIYSRNVYLKPKVLFEINTTFQIECKFDQRAVMKYNGDLDKIQSFIEKNKTAIVNESRACGLSSLLVSQLTVLDHLNPMILSARCEDEKM